MNIRIIWLRPLLPGDGRQLEIRSLFLVDAKHRSDLSTMVTSYFQDIGNTLNCGGMPCPGSYRLLSTYGWSLFTVRFSISDNYFVRERLRENRV